MNFRRVGVFVAGLAALALGCSKSSKPPPPPQCTGGASAVSGLPLPKGCVAQPAGTAGNLQVLPWAGFKGAISYTFDDASPSQVENYETLNKPGVRMTFYVVPKRVEQTDKLGNTHLAQWKAMLADGHEFGSHTLDHCQLTPATDTTPYSYPLCAWGEAPVDSTPEQQVAGANDFVKNVIGQRDALGNPAVWTMASPYGDDSWSPIALASGLIAHRGVWTNQPGSFIPAGDIATIGNLPCWAGAGYEAGWGNVDKNQSTYEKIINDARGRGRWTIFLFHGILPSAWDNDGECCAVEAANIAGSMEHLKRWGDVWGDTVANIASYNIAQSLFASLTPVDGDAGAKTWTWTLPANFPPGKYLRVSVDGGTLTQNIDGHPVTLPWNPRGFYEVSLSAGNVTLNP